MIIQRELVLIGWGDEGSDIDEESDSDIDDW